MTSVPDHEDAAGEFTDRRAHARIDALELNVNIVNRDLAKLANEMESMDKTVNEVRSDLSGIRTDINWIREALFGRVLRVEAQATKASTTVEKVKGDGDLAKALGVIALLAAVIAGVLGVNPHFRS